MSERIPLQVAGGSGFDLLARSPLEVGQVVGVVEAVVAVEVGEEVVG